MLQLHSTTVVSSGMCRRNAKAAQWQLPLYVLFGGVRGGIWGGRNGVCAGFDGWLVLRKMERRENGLCVVFLVFLGGEGRRGSAGLKWGCLVRFWPIARLGRLCSGSL